MESLGQVLCNVVFVGNTRNTWNTRRTRWKRTKGNTINCSAFLVYQVLLAILSRPSSLIMSCLGGAGGSILERLDRPVKRNTTFLSIFRVFVGDRATFQLNMLRQRWILNKNVRKGPLWFTFCKKQIHIEFVISCRFSVEGGEVQCNCNSH